MNNLILINKENNEKYTFYKKYYKKFTYFTNPISNNKEIELDQNEYNLLLSYLNYYIDKNNDDEDNNDDHKYEIIELFNEFKDNTEYYELSLIEKIKYREIFQKDLTYYDKKIFDWIDINNKEIIFNLKKIFKKKIIFPRITDFYFLIICLNKFGYDKFLLQKFIFKNKILFTCLREKDINFLLDKNIISNVIFQTILSLNQEIYKEIFIKKK